MAMIVVQQHPVQHSSTPPPLPSALSLSGSAPRAQTPIPNKHLPVCPTGPPPASSKVPAPSISTTKPVKTFLYPPTKFPKVYDNPPVYTIDADQLAAALDEASTRALPEPNKVFPWLHGLHPDNQIQLAFFVPRRRTLRRIPKCLRSIVIVKVGGELASSRVKGAVAPGEIINGSTFPDPDPPVGFSVRNFQIQTAKLAPISDIILYGEDGVRPAQVLSLAKEISSAQEAWRHRFDPGEELRLVNTFVLSTPFHHLEQQHPELVAVRSDGQVNDGLMDFFRWERIEMCNMSHPSEISENVYLGFTPELSSNNGLEAGFDLMIEAHDVANIPDPRYLTKVTALLESGPQSIEFPSSGSLIASELSQVEVFDIIDTCRWIYHITHSQGSEQMQDQARVESDGDIQMITLGPRPKKVLIHCADGYTESSLLAIAYFMFAEGVPAHEAWLRLHCEKKRNFFAYPSDVTFLTTIQHQLLRESPAAKAARLINQPDPGWMARLDGSLPSRILPYMYLGNLTHANNPELLKALGIGRILSIGEPVSWPETELMSWGSENLMMIDDVQDNGIDPLTKEFDRCLQFIEKGKLDGTAALVHCRVGVSRSATICIAEVMASLGLSFPRAYCYVRARRLNVIIQPHLRFVYELLKWDEHLQLKRNQPIRRELEWTTIAREIALMNKPYSRQ
ncbi:pps1 dual specificty phosphatase [Coccidioides immitis RS]|uniref:Pps1 dual specificty phosphatase n=2 Tax=Coccidioides immitis TaxID=5501 RepID=A0A0E1RUQ3_COCIM|nr:pps1 dual specificty phosphatase [Coccidioides immitis RS]EAS27968.1 pps1 dual specificty phosphatase [Coccidioides immitis RS]KMP08774.1 dual specificity protein phosphatase PPS1 [Coccidioides immitis RMSCC 2394]